jgi:phosphotransferase system HPr (HPr) family protein
MATSNDIVIQHKLGLHARPAAMFVKTAAKFSSRITLENLSRGAQPVNAKSILSVLSAGVKKGEQIRVTAEGADEAEAVNALTELVVNNFGEAEN